jgi:hypothetical protein
MLSPLSVSLLQIVFLLVGVSIVYDQLPEARDVRFASEFSADRAWGHLAALADLGPRVLGSYENDVMAAKIITTRAKGIADRTRSDRTVTIDHQVVDGGFYVAFMEGLTLNYRGVQNVVVRLSSSPYKPGKSALMLNCHFDSVPHSPGASDDAISCAVMLEVLEVMATDPNQEPLAHDVIFLFNGAEEQFLPASHGFITRHPWAADIKTFINLEAAGAGGREMLFQSGPGNIWILEAYLKHAPYPSASVIGQEVFQSGIIPSDTDFRIFRDFGNLSGLDIAFVRNGYVYHTKYDAADRIPRGSIQRAGDNVLAVTRALTAMNQFPSGKRTDSPPVFFEILGYCALSYSGAIGVFVNVTACLLSLAIMYKRLDDLAKKTDRTVIQCFKVVAGVLVFHICCLIAGLAISLVIGFALGSINTTLAWYSNPSLIIAMYAFPTVSLTIYVMKRLQDRLPKTSSRNLEMEYFSAIQIEFIVSTLAMTFTGLQSAYAAMMFVLLPALGSTFFDFAEQRWPSLTRSLDQYLPVLRDSLLLPLLHTLYMSYLLFSIFVPIMGRSGTAKNPELTIGVLATVLAHVIVSCSMVRVPKSSDAIGAAKALAFLWGLCMLFVVFTSAGFPYDGDYDNLAPMRIRAFHARRTFFDVHGNVVLNDSGITLSHLDYRDPAELDRFVDGYDRRIMMTEADCKKYIYCGMAFERSLLEKKKRIAWIPYGAPSIPESLATRLSVVRQTRVSDDVQRVFFRLTGPSRTTIIMSPSLGANLTRWNLTDDQMLRGRLKWNDRDAFFVALVRGRETAPDHTFWIDVRASDAADAILTVAVCGHFQHGETMIQKDFRFFLDTFPEWVFPWAWTTDIKMYEFKLKNIS